MVLTSFDSFLWFISLYLSRIDNVNGEPVHQCVHEKVQQMVPPRTSHIEYNNHPFDRSNDSKTSNHGNARRLTESGGALEHQHTAPIRVQSYYDPQTFSSSNGPGEDGFAYIQSLMSTVTRFYHNHVAVVPVEHGLYLHRECEDTFPSELGTNCLRFSRKQQCGLVTIPDEHFAGDLQYLYPHSSDTIELPAGSGIPDTDLIIYVSFSETGCGSSTLAWAVPCVQDQYGRPIAGTVNVCPYMFESSHRPWKQDVVVMLHETNHILIMAPELWDDFREWNGDLIPHHRVVSEQQEDGLIYIISPGVAQWSKEHFGCPMLIGFPLEDTGSGGSVGAHWDERHAMSSLMGSTIWGSLHYMTNVTLWLMVDSGWYAVDFSAAEPYHWGKGTGCAWFETKCVDESSSLSNWPRFFCTSTRDNGCSYNYEAPAFCEYYLYRNDLPAESQYFSDNPNGGGPAAADYCPFRDPTSDHHHVEGSCREIKNNVNLEHQIAMETYDIDSRCVDIVDDISSDISDGYCVRHECIGYDPELAQWSVVLISIAEHHHDHIPCTRDDSPVGQQVTLKYVPSMDAYIRCPDVDSICGSTSRPFACVWGHWNDRRSECVCSPGYIGEFCEIEDRLEFVDGNNGTLDLGNTSNSTNSTKIGFIETTAAERTGKCCECLRGTNDKGCVVDGECEDIVCQQDPLCCALNWASPCVVLATEVCEATGGDPPPCCGCTTQHSGRGCPGDEQCEAAICSKYPICCGLQWDRKCASFAIPICMNGD